MGKSKNKPKAAKIPHSRQVRIGSEPPSHDAETISWHFNQLDLDHGLWGWSSLSLEELKTTLGCLQDLEKKTWANLKEDRIHHSLDTENFTKDAQDRLEHLQLDDQPQLFSLHLKSTLRVYGIRDGKALRLLWHDPYHIYEDKRAAYFTTRQ